MKKLALAAVAAFLISPGAQAETLRVATSGDFPPWAYIDAKGDITGFERDIVDTICKKIKADCTWSNQSFDSLLPSLQIGKFDLIISGISITDERALQIDFSTPYADPPMSMAALTNSPLASVTTREELEKALAGKTIGVQSGTTHAVVAEKHFKNADIRIYERNEHIVDDIIAGRLDAGLMERSVWKGLLDTRNDKAIAIFGPMLSSADYAEFGNGTGIAMKKGRDALRQRVNAAITEMLDDKTITNLSNKYFGYDVSYKKH